MNKKIYSGLDKLLQIREYAGRAKTLLAVAYETGYVTVFGTIGKN